MLCLSLSSMSLTLESLRMRARCFEDDGAAPLRTGLSSPAEAMASSSTLGKRMRSRGEWAELAVPVGDMTGLRPDLRVVDILPARIGFKRGILDGVVIAVELCSKRSIRLLLAIGNLCGSRDCWTMFVSGCELRAIGFDVSSGDRCMGGRPCKGCGVSG